MKDLKLYIIDTCFLKKKSSTTIATKKVAMVTFRFIFKSFTVEVEHCYEKNSLRVFSKQGTVKVNVYTSMVSAIFYQGEQLL